jgi:hydrogenase maturation factor
MLPATKVLCCDFGMDPFGLIGSGSLLVGCAREGKGELEESLASRGVSFSG